jgi:hypothetical protein
MPVISDNTPTGTSVEVSLEDDAAAGQYSISVTFGEVTTAGNTTVSKSQTPPEDSPTSSAFSFLGDYYDFSTTAEYASGIDLAIPYDDTGLTQAEEEALTLLHYDEVLQEWADATTSIDTLKNIIYGHSDSFSTFAVAVKELNLIWVSPLHDGTSVTTPDGPYKLGRTIPVKFRLHTPDGALISDSEAQALTADLNSFYAAPGCSGAPEDPGDDLPDTGGTFRYDAGDDLFIYNLSTKNPLWLANYTYRLEIAIDGMKVGEVFVGLR